MADLPGFLPNPIIGRAVSSPPSVSIDLLKPMFGVPAPAVSAVVEEIQSGILAHQLSSSNPRQICGMLAPPIVWERPPDKDDGEDDEIVRFTGYRVIADWNGDGAYSHALSDISKYVMSMSWGIGAAGAPPTRDAAGACTITVDNSTAIFSPSNRSGELFGKLYPSVRVKIQMRFYSDEEWRDKYTGYVQSFAARLGANIGVNTTVISAYGAISRLTRSTAAHPLIKNQSTGAVCELIMSKSSIPLVAGGGMSNMGMWWSAGDQPIIDALRDIADEEMGRICEDESGALMFFDRNHHRANERAAFVQSRFGDDGLPIWSLRSEEQQNAIFNMVSIPVRIFNISPPGTVLAVVSDVQGQQGGRPPLVPARFIAGGAYVPGEITVTIAPNIPVSDWGMIDYEANAHIDRSGAALTSNITAEMVEDSGTERVVKFKNSGTTPAYLVLLRAIGTSIIEGSAYSVEAEADENSIDRYGERPYPSPGNWCLSDVDAVKKADHIIALYGEPREHVTFQVKGNYSDDCMDEVYERKIGDRIHITAGKDFGLYLDDDFIVDEIKHTVTAARLHTATIRATVAPKIHLGALPNDPYRPNVIPPEYQEALDAAKAAQDAADAAKDKADAAQNAANTAKDKADAAKDKADAADAAAKDAQDAADAAQTAMEAGSSAGPFLGSDILHALTVAGSFNYTFPNLFKGRSYVVMIHMKGGGGGGAGANSQSRGGGGGEGETVYIRLTVAPGATISGTVGDGGYAGPIGSSGETGNATSITNSKLGTITAAPGEGGRAWGKSGVNGLGGGVNSFQANIHQMKGMNGDQPWDDDDNTPNFPGGDGGGATGGRGQSGGDGDVNMSATAGTFGGGGGGGAGSRTGQRGGAGFIYIWLSSSVAE